MHFSPKSKPHRFMFNNPIPLSLEGTKAVFENKHGSTASPYRVCRRGRNKGWMVLLNTQTEYSMSFDGMEHLSNISYTGQCRKNIYSERLDQIRKKNFQLEYFFVQILRYLSIYM